MSYSSGGVGGRAGRWGGGGSCPLNPRCRISGGLSRSSKEACSEVLESGVWNKSVSFLSRTVFKFFVSSAQSQTTYVRCVGSVLIFHACEIQTIQDVCICVSVPPSPLSSPAGAMYPKTLGFSLGLDYRESAMVISAKNSTK